MDFDNDVTPGAVGTDNMPCRMRGMRVEPGETMRLGGLGRAAGVTRGRRFDEGGADCGGRGGGDFFGPTIDGMGRFSFRAGSDGVVAIDDAAEGSGVR